MARQLDLLAFPIVEKNRFASAYFEELFYQVIADLGGDTDTSIIDLVNTNITNIATNASDIDALEALTALTVVSTAIDYTASGNVLIRATAALAITLDSTPADRQVVGVFHDATTGSVVSVTDGSSTDNLIVNNTLVWYTYYSDLLRWVP